jgi:hypothetical protein
MAVLAGAAGAALDDLPPFLRDLHEAARMVRNSSARSLSRLAMSFKRTISEYSFCSCGVSRPRLLFWASSSTRLQRATTGPWRPHPALPQAARAWPSPCVIPRRTPVAAWHFCARSTREAPCGPARVSPPWVPRPAASAVLASIIIRHSGHPSVVMMEPTQYRKRDDLSSTVGGGGVSS